MAKRESIWLPIDDATCRAEDFVSYNSKTGDPQRTPMFHVRGYYKHLSHSAIGAILDEIENVQSVYDKWYATFQKQEQKRQSDAMVQSDVVSNPIVETKAIVPTVTANNAAVSINQWLIQQGFTAQEVLVNKYAEDDTAKAMYAEYLATLPKANFASALAAKKSVSSDAVEKAKDITAKSATKETLAETERLKKAARAQVASMDATLKAAKRKGKSVPVSFSITVHGKKISGLTATSKGDATQQVVGKELTSVIANKGNETVLAGRFPSQDFDRLVANGFIYDVKYL